MNFTIFTLFTSFLWVNFFMFCLIFLVKQTNLYKHFSIYTFLCFIILCILRLTIVIEFPFTIELDSHYIMTTLQHSMRYVIFSFCVENIKIEICIKHILLTIWLVGSVLFTFKSFQSCKIIYRLAHFLPETNDESIMKILFTIQSITNFHKKIKVIVHNKVKSPFIIGYFKPTIMLPALNFTEEERKGILMHEILHVKYHHVVLKLMVEIIKILFWWNPFVHMFYYNVNNILECHVDNKLSNLLNKQEQENYLNGIIKVIQNCDLPNQLSFVISGLANSTKSYDFTKHRFTMILEEVYSKNKKLKSSIFVFSTLLLFFMSYLFVIQPYGEPTMEDYNDNAPIITKEYYIVKEKDSYTIYNPNGIPVETYSGEIEEKFYYLKVKEEN